MNESKIELQKMSNALLPPLQQCSVSGSLHSGKLVLDACCGGRMFWYEKENQNVLFMDERQIDKGAFPNNWNPNWCVNPDVVADFRNMPFPDKSFKLIIYDPPHLTSGSMKSVINKKYGLLNKETWKEDIIQGFKECWRVLDEHGTLIFKWNEANIKASDLVKAFPVKPLFGDFTGKTGKTIWFTFMKGVSVSNDR